MKMTKKYLVASFVLTMLVQFWLLLTDLKKISNPEDFSRGLQWMLSFSHMRNGILIFTVLAVLLWMGDRYKEYLHKYRYLMLGLVLFISVIFKINGSSLGILGVFLNSSQYDQVLLGVSRTLRSDEWSVNIPFQLSQSFNDYKYISDLIRGGNTDTFILSSLPSWTLSIIFKPATVGFLFLGFERGLSFLWTFKILFLFITVYDLGYLITKKSKSLSLFLAITITFSSVIQWWMGMIEMIGAGSIFIILFDKYLKEHSIIRKVFYILAMAWAGNVYILTFYPAWQVPLGYIFLALFLFVIMENKDKLSLTWKIDGLLFIVFMGLIIAGTGYTLQKAMPTISATLNTVYPGQRTSFGGESGTWIFDSIFSIYYPFTDIINERAMDVVFDLFPLVPIFAIIVLYKSKDRLLGMFLLIDFLFLSYITIGFSPVIAKITLLSLTISVRLLSVFGILNLLIIARIMSISKNIVIRKAQALLIIAIFSALVFILSYVFSSGYFLETTAGLDGIPLFILMIIGVIIFALYGYALLRNKRGQLLLLGVVVSVLSGLTVNPVRIGADVITKSDTVTSIKSLNTSTEDKWLVEGELPLFPYNNVPLMSGASTINSTNPYPNLSLWESLDSDRRFSDIYNRYAHISIKLTNSKEVNFTLNFPDTFTVDLPVDRLKELGVTYILSNRQLEEMSTEEIWFEKIRDVFNGQIFKVHFNDFFSINQQD